MNHLWKTFSALQQSYQDVYDLLYVAVTKISKYVIAEQMRLGYFLE